MTLVFDSANLSTRLSVRSNELSTIVGFLARYQSVGVIAVSRYNPPEQSLESLAVLADAATARGAPGVD